MGGLDDAEYNDAEQEGVKAVLEFRQREGALPDDADAYAATSARHAALAICEDRRRLLLNPDVEADGDPQSVFRSGKRARPTRTLSEQQLQKLAHVRYVMWAHVLSFVPSLERHSHEWITSVDPPVNMERSIYGTLANLIAHDLEREPPGGAGARRLDDYADFVDKLVAFRKRYIHLGGKGEWIESHETAMQPPPWRGRRRRITAAALRESGTRVTMGPRAMPDEELCAIDPDAMWFDRLRRDAASRLVDHALELCGYTPEEVRWSDQREAAKKSKFLAVWAAKLRDAFDSDDRGDPGRDPTFRRRNRR